MPANVILIIEDDEVIGQLVTQVLHEAGYTTEWVRDVETARARSEAGMRPAAILSDLLVAGSDGPAALATQLAQVFPNTPLTFMTGVPPRRRAQLGVTHERIIEKPFELETLVAMVRAMVSEQGAKQ